MDQGQQITTHFDASKIMKPDEARQPQNHLRRLRLLRVLRIFHDIQLLCGKMSKNELSKIAKEENLFRLDDTMVLIGPIKKKKNIKIKLVQHITKWNFVRECYDKIPSVGQISRVQKLFVIPQTVLPRTYPSKYYLVLLRSTMTSTVLYIQIAYTYMWTNEEQRLLFVVNDSRAEGKEVQVY